MGSLSLIPSVKKLTCGDTCRLGRDWRRVGAMLSEHVRMAIVGIYDGYPSSGLAGTSFNRSMAASVNQL